MSTVPCSDGSLSAREQLAGTAPQALAWVALEQNGPWGPRAFTDSHLDPRVGRAIEDTAAAYDVRPALIRSPGRHADDHRPVGPARRLLVAHTHPRGSWLLEALLDAPEHVLDLDWAALRAGDRDAVRRSLPTAEVSDRSHLLVCANGRRDLCCAVKGRPVAAGAAAALPGRVWEVTHTSGHRFAPTALLLPAGTLHGRLDVAGAVSLLVAADRGGTVLDGSRGRSTWPAPAQAAELAVREAHRILGLDDLEVVDHAADGHRGWLTTITHTDGRAWRVRTEAEPTDVARAESCGKALNPMTWTTHDVEPLVTRPA